MAEPLQRLRIFQGIDNVSDNANMNPVKGALYVREADNIDIDDAGMPHRRDGYSSQILSSTTVHSIWSNGDTCLFCDGTIFKRLNRDYTITNLITDIDPTDRMDYVPVGDNIYFSNNSIVGYVYGGLTYPFPAPAMTFKTIMSGGQHLEFYNNRLYAAHWDNLFFSDATVLTRMDARKNAIAFGSHINMVKAVLDGMYIGTDKGVVFLKGTDPIADLAQVHISDNGVVNGTAIVVDDDEMYRGAKGKVVYWVAKDGAVYRGLPGGYAKQIHKLEGFQVADLDIGTAILKKDHKYKQYLAICTLKAGTGGASGEVSIPQISAVSGG